MNSSPSPAPSKGPSILQLNVARITQPPVPKLPRPDDPIPRKPPVMLTRNESIGNLKRVASATFKGSNDLKRVASGSLANVMIPKRPKLVGGSVSNLGSGVRLGATKSSGEDVFKVPELPVKQKAKEDVFGGGSQPKAKQTNAKGKAKAVVLREADDDLEFFEADFDAGSVEKENKNVRFFVSLPDTISHPTAET